MMFPPRIKGTTHRAVGPETRDEPKDLDKREFHRRELIKRGGSVAVVGLGYAAGRDLIDRADGVSGEFQDTLGVVLPLIDGVLAGIDQAEAACDGVAPYLGQLEELRDGLITLSGVLKPKSKKPNSTTTTVPGSSTPEHIDGMISTPQILEPTVIAPPAG